MLSLMGTHSFEQCVWETMHCSSQDRHSDSSSSLVFQAQRSMGHKALAEYLCAAPIAASAMAGSPPLHDAAPKSFVPIMTTSTCGGCCTYSWPCSKRHIRCAA